MTPILVIVSGPPCTGKTTLGRRIARDLGWPFVNKDGIKELLFDALGWQDREWSRRLSHASYAVLFHCVECQLAAGRSLVVESNFRAEFHTDRFLELARRYAFRPFQIQCTARGEILVERFRRRAESGERHPGHVDHLCYDELESILLRGRHDALDVGGQLIEVDTSDFDQIDYGEILRRAEEWCESCTPAAF